MMELVAVFFGGGIGAVLRWQSQSFLNVPEQWPWGTLAVNVVGGFAAGCCLALAHQLSAEVRLFLMTGILGGLTTFSALSYEMIAMVHRGTLGAAIFYGLSSLVLATLVCWAGYLLVNRFL